MTLDMRSCDLLFIGVLADLFRLGRARFVSSVPCLPLRLQSIYLAKRFLILILFLLGVGISFADCEGPGNLRSRQKLERTSTEAWKPTNCGVTWIVELPDATSRTKDPLFWFHGSTVPSTGLIVFFFTLTGELATVLGEEKLTIFFPSFPFEMVVRKGPNSVEFPCAKVAISCLKSLITNHK